MNFLAQNFKLGTKGGVSIPSLSQKEDNIFAKDFNSRLTVEAAIIAEFSINDHLSIQPELIYAIRGGKREGLQPLIGNQIPAELSALLPDGVIPYANFENVSNPNYLEIPILIKYGWGETWRFYVNAGPYFGFLVNAKQKTSGSSPIFLDAEGQTAIPNPIDPGSPLIASFDAETDIKDDLESLNIGIHGGLGIIRKLNDKNELFFDSRISSGFIPIQKDETFGESTVGSFVFSLGYMYTFGN